MKRFYVTKKQVKDFIKNKTYLFETKEEFKGSVDEVIKHLSICDKAQIKFYNRVREELR